MFLRKFALKVSIIGNPNAKIGTINAIVAAAPNSLIIEMPANRSRVHTAGITHEILGD